MSINYEFSDLEAFLAVKETGSFHLAAKQLNLSQSAVTRRIQKLEEALDSRLFERTTRAVKPTLAAKRLQARAEAILDSAEEAALAMRDESVAFVHQRSAIVTLAILPSLVPVLLPKAIRTLEAQGYSARFRILDQATNEVAEAVAQGDADFGVSSIPSLEPSTRFEHLFDDPIVIVLPPSHALCSLERLDWRDLRDCTLIVPQRGTGNRMQIDEAMGHARLPLTWRFEVGRTTTALEMVAADVGIALLPASSILSNSGSDLCIRPITAPQISRSIGLISPLGQPETDVVAATKQAIMTAAQTAAKVMNVTMNQPM